MTQQRLKNLINFNASFLVEVTIKCIVYLLWSHLGYGAVLPGRNDARISRRDITSHRLYPEVKATGYPAILPNYTASFSGRLCYGTRQGCFHLQMLRKMRLQVNETPQGQRTVKIQVFCGTTLRPYVIVSRRFERTKRPYLPKRRMSTTQWRSTVFQTKRMLKWICSTRADLHLDTKWSAARLGARGGRLGSEVEMQLATAVQLDTNRQR